MMIDDDYEVIILVKILVILLEVGDFSRVTSLAFQNLHCAIEALLSNV